ncbi:AraC family transcriptional regulator [Aquabacterium sp. A7-Y]|uniref:AraC family transcriptional regulator n=1 Tax=Aquabacterium sp. A7-Y TaxID=1349605 RepID=UPI00223DA4F1|nr:AraC family transcriptional regulator [Aquabacterium sp. A7-Y]MCW7540259.1 AraC family transcriptional regulator [Aquabacterium sp. A7-Y]
MRANFPIGPTRARGTPNGWRGATGSREPTAAVYESAVTLIRLLMRHGISEAEIEATTGMSLENTRHPDARVPVSQIERLWQMAADRLHHPTIALELHHHYPENKLHFVAHLGMRCANMRSAIEHWRKYAFLVSEIDDVDYIVEGNTARFIYSCRDPRYTARWFAEHFLSLALWFAKCFTGHTLKLTGARFMHGPPPSRAAHERTFQVPVEFSASENSISFDASYLDLPFRTADSYLHHFLVAKADELKAGLEQEARVENRVVAAISLLLTRGEEVTLDRVAELLKQSPRRLRQVLEAEGQRFRDLFDEVRREAAARYLMQGMSISQVAVLLGFSEPSALQHAFRRWYDTSPGDFRQKLATGGISLSALGPRTTIVPPRTRPLTPQASS